jgi:iron(III) transport system permease protein
VATLHRTIALPRRRAARPPLWAIVPSLIAVGLAILPVVYVILRAREAGGLRAWALLVRHRTLDLLTNTGRLVIAVTFASIVLGVATAWCVERTDLPGRRAWNVLVTLPLAVPAFVASYSWASLTPRVEGFGGAVLVLTLSSFPLVHLPVAAALRGTDPSLEESAHALGYGAWHTFFRVTLPQMRPALYGGALLISLHMLAEFGALAILRFDTFTTAIFDQYRVAFDSAAAAMLVAVLLALCLVVLAVEMLARGRARYARIGSGAARPQPRVHLGWAAAPITGGLFAVALLALGVPMGSLVYWLTKGSSAAFPVGQIWSAAVSSITLAVVAALATTALAVPIAFLAVRHRGLLTTIIERTVYTQRAMPGLVIALALVFVSVHYVFDLYQSLPLLIIGYVMLFLPLALAGVRGAVEQVPASLEESARVLGRRPIQVLGEVTLPLITPGLGAGAALVFLEVMNELTETLVLRPTGTETLATEVWTHTANLEYAAAAPYAAILVLLSAVPTFLLTRRRPVIAEELPVPD